MSGNPTNYDISNLFRDTIAKTIKKANLSREQVIDGINYLSGLKLSKAFFDQTLSKKLNYRFPAEALPAFCHVTGSLEPLQVLASPLGALVLNENEAKKYKLFKLLEEKAKLEKQIEKLMKEVGYEKI